MNARKNSAVLTFSASVRMPSKNAWRLPCGASAGMPGIRRAFASERSPRNKRYAAPTYLTTRKPLAEAASRAERPTAATATCTRPPTAVPMVEAMPPTTPPDKVRAMTYRMPGPGVKASTRAAAMKNPSSRVDRIWFSTGSGVFDPHQPKLADILAESAELVEREHLRQAIQFDMPDPAQFFMRQDQLHQPVPESAMAGVGRKGYIENPGLEDKIADHARKRLQVASGIHEPDANL